MASAGSRLLLRWLVLLLIPSEKPFRVPKVVAAHPGGGEQAGVGQVGTPKLICNPLPPSQAPTPEPQTPHSHLLLSTLVQSYQHNMYPL